MSYLSYQVQRIQRNKYITFMVIYVTIVLNVYLRLLYHIYEKRGDFAPPAQEERASLSEPRSSTDARVSTGVETKKSK